MRRAARAASSALGCNQKISASYAFTSGNAVHHRVSSVGAQLNFIAELSMSTKKTLKTKEIDGRVGELLELIEHTRNGVSSGGALDMLLFGDSELELEQLLELYDVLKQRKQPDSDVFETVFGIARIYDDQLEDGDAAVKYYKEALEILEGIPTDVTVWGAYMRVTTLGALAVCYENLGVPDEAEQYFEDAIGAYEEHCDQAPDETEVSDLDISLLADLNASAAMIHYHYAGNLLGQDRWEEAKNVTKIALVLAENSSMPEGELGDLQQCIHELWVEMD
ncbi:hypothetical protein P3T76_014426 [Phytophthora citrophthora]|uniref:Uncharacterized protein n=1 Tax=Phytophthora citrophthora TaxID=4793 RepID=A0AAD9G253_9STRA|nr:hypothetical protein P3T76_014426 [Phytophthora citrophthora]